MNVPAVFGLVIVASIPGTVFWPYFAGFVIAAVGIFTSGSEVSRARGTDKIICLAPVFFAVPMAVFASQHFTQSKAVSTLVPSWLPAHLFWTYFIGTAIIAASLSIVAKKQARLAALLLAFTLILFVLFLHIPRIMRNPRDVMAWATAFRDLSFSSGALAFAGAQHKPKGNGKNLVTIARIFISVSALFFGAEHFLHPEFMPGVDFDRSMPDWIPLRVFWSYLAGTVFIAAGMALLINKKTRFAATWLGFTTLLLVLFVYLPIMAAKPLDIDNGLNFLVSTLAFSGVALLLAKALPKTGAI